MKKLNIQTHTPPYDSNSVFFTVFKFMYLYIFIHMYTYTKVMASKYEFFGIFLCFEWRNRHSFSNLEKDINKLYFWKGATVLAWQQTNSEHEAGAPNPSPRLAKDAAVVPTPATGCQGGKHNSNSCQRSLLSPRLSLSPTAGLQHRGECLSRGKDPMVETPSMQARGRGESTGRRTRSEAEDISLQGLGWFLNHKYTRSIRRLKGNAPTPLELPAWTLGHSFRKTANNIGP